MMLPQIYAVLLAGAAALALAQPDTIAPTANMSLPRAGHTATVLNDGRVLIVGGCVVTGCEQQLTNSSEFYTPASNRFSPGPSLNVARVGHQSLRLANGELLVFGGWAGQDATDVVERYNAQQNRFERLGKMTQARDGFTTTLLNDGQVLIVGGYQGRMQRLANSELYNPAKNTFTPVGSLHTARTSHTATLLANGQVLVVGGSSGRGAILTSAEVFDPQTLSFYSVAPLNTARHKHAAVALPQGDVMIIGGASAGEFSDQYNTSEKFDYRSQKFYPTAKMQSGRFKIPDAVALLDDGNVFIAGSAEKPEIYQQKTNSFRQTQGGINLELSFSTATKLPDGRVLVTGGYDGQIRVTAKTWMYQPQ
jgi:hypothetical protein